MATLRVGLEVRDYDMWRTAFGQDAGGRQRAGARRYRIFRPVDDPKFVMIDIDFDTVDQAERFLEVMRNDVWSSPEKAPAKVGTPQTRIVDMVESKDY